MSTILTITTPEKTILSTDVKRVTLPTTDGEITVYAGHVALISSLDSGDIVVEVENGEVAPIAVTGGFVQIHPDSVKILADFAEHISADQDEDIAAAKARAQELVDSGENLSEEEFNFRARQLEFAMMREQLHGKWKNRKYKKFNL